VVNYAETPDWDAKVRELTGGRGVDCVVEIGGPGTIAMSLQTLAVGGHISLIGASPSAAGRDVDILRMQVRTGRIVKAPNFATRQDQPTNGGSPGLPSSRFLR
jgi:NADPH:quinone reductase-like Zn-dependent oxidoreductase